MILKFLYQLFSFVVIVRAFIESKVSVLFYLVVQAWFIFH